jgi:hypothetical protein
MGPVGGAFGRRFFFGSHAVEIYEASVSLMVRAMVVSARWAARSRRLSPERTCARSEAGQVAQLEARVMLLEDAVAFRDARLEVLEKRLGEERSRRPYPLMDRLRLLWLIEHYQIPKRRVKETFGVARSSIHRWLRAFQQGKLGGRRRAVEPVNKTPRKIAELIWDIFVHNPMRGRHRIAMTLWALGGASRGPPSGTSYCDPDPRHRLQHPSR